MGLRELEAGILRELRRVIGNSKVRQKDIQEWSTTPVTAQGEEKLAYLPELHIYVSYLEPKK
jgi:hypothetical protein